MKILLALLICVGLHAAEMTPCDLSSVTEEDWKSLGSLEKPFVRQEVEKLPDSEKQNVCLGRRLYRLIKSGDQAVIDKLWIPDVPVRLSRFLTKDEYTLVRKHLPSILSRFGPPK